MSHSGQLVLTFIVGGVIGVLVGWNVARARYAPPTEDATSVRTWRNEIVTFLKNAALVAGAAVVILALAVNIVHSRR